jgi:hypothetical protein
MHLIKSFIGILGICIMLTSGINCDDKSSNPEDVIEPWQIAFIGNETGAYDDLIIEANDEIVVFGQNDGKIHLARLDESGQQIWTEHYGASMLHFDWYGVDIRECGDGGYFVLGGNSKDMTIVKAGPSGGQVWEKTVSPQSSEYIHGSAVLPIEGGNCIVVASVCQSESQNCDIMLIGMNSDGSIEFCDTLETDQDEFPRTSIITSNDHILTVGQILNGDNHDIYFLMTDKTGSIINENSFGSSQEENIVDVVEVGTNAFLGVGTRYGSSSRERYLYLVKMDVYGEIIWEETLGDGNIVGTGICATSDGNYLICGGISSDPNDPFHNITSNHLVKINPSGSIIWENTISNDSLNTLCYSCAQTAEGGFVVVGDLYHYGPGGRNRYIAKTDANGNSADSIVFIEEY